MPTFFTVSDITEYLNLTDDEIAQHFINLYKRTRKIDFFILNDQKKHLQVKIYLRMLAALSNTIHQDAIKKYDAEVVNIDETSTHILGVFIMEIFGEIVSLCETDLNLNMVVSDFFYRMVHFYKSRNKEKYLLEFKKKIEGKDFSDEFQFIFLSRYIVVSLENAIHFSSYRNYNLEKARSNYLNATKMLNNEELRGELCSWYDDFIQLHFLFLKELILSTFSEVIRNNLIKTMNNKFNTNEPVLRKIMSDTARFSLPPLELSVKEQVSGIANEEKTFKLKKHISHLQGKKQGSVRTISQLEGSSFRCYPKDMCFLYEVLDYQLSMFSVREKLLGNKNLRDPNALHNDFSN
ncbi:MAG: hypothetical protein JSS53_05215 [Proteobacteria bacterium]|nr:hypothetical protein [Pseudomonadota bacterium]